MNTSSAPQKTAISFWQALRFWFKLGFISFGGPAGQISIMHQELVEKRHWISERRFLHALNYCMLLPGPEAQQLATYLGWLMHRTWGGVLAGVLFVLPSLFILIGLSWLYVVYGNTPLLAGLFYGIKPAVTAIVLQAAWRIGGRTLKNSWLCLIAAAAFAAIFIGKIPFPWIVLTAALCGYVGGRIQPSIFQMTAKHGGAEKISAPAIIDDHTPIPEHAQFQWRRLAGVCCAGLVLWSLPITLLTWHWGWSHPYTQMSWFFTKAALLTFGGAYAVLPYVYQGAVEHYRWLTPTQMVDGLALGETTPGPLIMVVAFVAFVGAYFNTTLQTLFGGVPTLWAGALAAMLVTWFTFLPSFIFILAGAPLIESTHNDLKFTAPLTAITAAVVGVIVNLALFFAWHVFWPTGWHGAFDYWAAGIAGMALVLLFVVKWSVLRVLAVCAVAGLLLSSVI